MTCDAITAASIHGLPIVLPSSYRDAAATDLLPLVLPMSAGAVAPGLTILRLMAASGSASSSAARVVGVGGGGGSGGRGVAAAGGGAGGGAAVAGGASAIPVAIRYRVTGKVQGVFFRKHTRTEALRLGISGWVANAADGSVVGVAEGSAVAMEAFRTWLRTRGSPKSRITGASFEGISVTGAFTTFTIARGDGDG